MIDLQGFPTTRPTPAYDQHGVGWDRGALLWPHLTSIVKKNVFDTGLQLTLTMFRSKKKSRKIKTIFRHLLLIRLQEEASWPSASYAEK